MDQKYDIPRESGLDELETDVVTYVVRENQQIMKPRSFFGFPNSENSRRKQLYFLKFVVQ